MGLDKYRLPASVREGVWLELPDAPGDKFRVRLPSRYNREYTAAQQRAVAVSVGDDFKLKPDLAHVDFFAWQEARYQAFLEFCVLDLPPGLTKAQLNDEYRPGLEVLFNMASDLADMEDAEADATTKKNSKPAKLAS
jgi:hypothetical protein